MILERNSEMAAALIGLKVHVTPEKTILPDSGETRVHFLLSGKWQAPSGGPMHSVAKLRTENRAGKLPATHPLRRQLLTSENRRAFIGFLKSPQNGIRIAPVPGTRDHAITADPGHGLPGLDSVRNTDIGIFKTHHLRTALALIQEGHRLMAIEGHGSDHVFYLTWEGPAGTATSLMTTWRETPKLLPADSPFLLASAFLQNRDVLVRRVNQLLGRLLLKKPHTTRQILIPSDASGKTWDKAQKFLLG
jgi:hypothetical protein